MDLCNSTSYENDAQLLCIIPGIDRNSGIMLSPKLVRIWIRFDTPNDYASGPD